MARLKKVKTRQQLKSSLGDIWKEFEKDASKVMREGTIKTKGRLSDLTPVDTGWASRHWSIGLNNSHDSEPVTIDPLTSLAFGDITHIFNNVPYIKRLDEGWSQQRPQGFTHLALIFAQGYFGDEYAKLSKEKMI